MLSEHDSPLALTKGAVKSCCLPGYLCVSFSGSPELAEKAFANFANSYPHGANFETTVSFFEASSSSTNNDYLVAFGKNPKLVTIRRGRDRKSTRLNSSHQIISYAVFCLQTQKFIQMIPHLSGFPYSTSY